MNITERFQILKDALFAMLTTDEHLLALARTDQDIEQALNYAEQAWQALEQEQKNFIKACSRGDV